MTCVLDTCSVPLRVEKKNGKAMSMFALNADMTSINSDLLSIQELLEERLGRSVEIVTNPPEFMRPAFRKRIQQDEVLLYETA